MRDDRRARAYFMPCALSSGVGLERRRWSHKTTTYPAARAAIKASLTRTHTHTTRTNRTHTQTSATQIDYPEIRRTRATRSTRAQRETTQHTHTKNAYISRIVGIELRARSTHTHTHTNTGKRARRASGQVT